MPFCPKCRYEYLPTVSECPDCEVKLVASLPLEPEESVDTEDPGTWEEPVEPETMESYDNWVPLARFSMTQYADMVLEALESKDIPAVLSDSTGNTATIHPPNDMLIDGSVTLFVPEEFAHDASQEGRIILGEEWDKVKLGDY